MKVEILRATIANKEAVTVGQVVDLSGDEASFLINIGKAKIWQMMDSVTEKPKRKQRQKRNIKRLVHEICRR